MGSDMFMDPPSAPKNKVYWTSSFKGHWPVGTSAIVVAPNKETAAALLVLQLHKSGLTQFVDPETLHEVDTTTQSAVIIQDGDY